MSHALRRRWNHLQHDLRKQKRILVAFSGGCDSTLVLAVSRQLLGKENVLAVTAVSPSLPQAECEAVLQLAATLDVSHSFIETHEFENPSYTNNPSNRCFFCKDELFSQLAPLAREREMRIVDGFNTSDRLEIRPGRVAAEKWDVFHPLDQAGLVKQDVRILSRWLGLTTWNKPAAPCLSSRVPYGTPITPSILRQIERAETALHNDGFPVARVRHYGSEARVEVPLETLARLKAQPRWNRLVTKIKEAGYETVVADPRGFQSGRLQQEALLVVSKEA